MIAAGPAEENRGSGGDCVEVCLKSVTMPDADYIKRHIRTVPDWPEPGVQFRDITPLLVNPKSLRVLIDLFVHRYMDSRLDLVATGGTMIAGARLVERLGATVVEFDGH